MKADDIQGHWPVDDMNVRAEFAKAAMQGMLARQYAGLDEIPALAVKAADALIAELNKPPKEVK
jgi:hypothetical protein